MAAFVWQRRSAPGALALMCFLLCVAIWNAGYGIEILSSGRADKLLWAKAEYPGVFLLPVAFFAFSAEHSGRRAWARAGRLATLAIVPVAIIALAFGDPFGSPQLIGGAAILIGIALSTDLAGAAFRTTRDKPAPSRAGRRGETLQHVLPRTSHDPPRQPHLSHHHSEDLRDPGGARGSLRARGSRRLLRLVTVD